MLPATGGYVGGHHLSLVGEACPIASHSGTNELLGGVWRRIVALYRAEPRSTRCARLVADSGHRACDAIPTVCPRSLEHGHRLPLPPPPPRPHDEAPIEVGTIGPRFGRPRPGVREPHPPRWGERGVREGGGLVAGEDEPWETPHRNSVRGDMTWPAPHNTTGRTTLGAGVQLCQARDADPGCDPCTAFRQRERHFVVSH